jgi:predicted permease
LIADLTLESEALRDSGSRARFLAQIVEQVEAVPGVDHAAIGYNLPLVSAYTETVRADGTTEPEALSIVNFLTGDYLTTMRIPLVAGRRFTAADNQPDAPPAMLINAALAGRLFPDGSPIGRRIRLVGESYEVVGLTGDVLAGGVEHGRIPLVFLPEALSGRFPFRNSSSSLVVRTHLPPLSVARSVQAAVLAFAPDQPVSNLRTYDHVMVQYTFTRRLMLGLFGAFAGIAVGLAAMGLYGIIAFSVDCRTNELGIRSALGASRTNLVLLVLGAGFKLTLAGIALGLLGGYFFTRLIATHLFGVSATDPLTLAGVTLLLVAVALVACWLPARRATRVDPMTALRAE